MVLGTIALARAASADLGSEMRHALQAQDADAMVALVTRGADVNLALEDGKTALMLAAKSGRAELVRALLAAGADVNAVTRNEGTALMFAAIPGDLETSEALIAQGANVNAVARFGWTAIMIACAKGHTELARRLLARGASPNLADIYGWTPLMRAVYEGREDVAGVLARDPRTQLDAKNDQGVTALHLAAERGALEVTRVLIAGGANPSSVDRSGRTPEMAASCNGHAAVASLIGAAALD